MCSHPAHMIWVIITACQAWSHNAKVIAGENLDEITAFFTTTDANGVATHDAAAQANYMNILMPASSIIDRREGCRTSCQAYEVVAPLEVRVSPPILNKHHSQLPLLLLLLYLLLRRLLPLLLPLLVQHYPLEVPLLHSLLRLLLREPAAAIEGRHSASSECDGDHGRRGVDQSIVEVLTACIFGGEIWGFNAQPFRN